MTKDEIIRKHQQYIFKCVTTYYKDPLVIDHTSEDWPGTRAIIRVRFQP